MSQLVAMQPGSIGGVNLGKELNVVKRWTMRMRVWGGIVVVGFGLACGGGSASWAGGTPTPQAGLSVLSPPVVMPAFDLPRADGTRMDSATLQGNVVVVRFWATW